MQTSFSISAAGSRNEVDASLTHQLEEQVKNQPQSKDLSVAIAKTVTAALDDIKKGVKGDPSLSVTISGHIAVAYVPPPITPDVPVAKKKKKNR